jgi:hypothetical protein
MSAEAPIFSIDTGLFPLNAFLEFPEDRRSQVLTALEAAIDVLPSENRLYWVRQKGSSQDEMLIEIKYGNAADLFATAIDPKFDPANWDRSSPETSELRGKFYNMIRTLSKEQILRGLETLKGI